ncbi:MAG: tRNA (adenosine(37)-N6)-threonylcarbamoyltransferase complex dimerization subunit type 1 TsaB [Rubrivivax sp.]
MNAPLLAFDTSTEAMAVAVQSAAGLFTWNGEGGAAASAQLIPQIHRLMEQAGLGFQGLRAIAFGNGPGAFTGLRTACAVAQGLALGAALPVLPVDSLRIVAEDVRVAHAGTWPGAASPQVHVAMDARMGEAYAGAYRWSGGRWQVLSAPALVALDALNAAWAAEAPRCVAGSALQAFGERLCTGPALRIEMGSDRAAALMRLAQQQWRDEGGIDAALALPLYLRDKVALTVAERQALHTARA